MKKLFILTSFLIIFSLLNAQTLMEGFEGGIIPAGWAVVNNDADENEWEVYETASSHTGNYCARVQYNSSGCDDWLITPQLTLADNDILSFWAATNSESYLEDFNVMISTTGNDIADFTITVAEVLQTPYDWTLYSYNLTDLPELSAGDNIYLAIQCVSVDEWYLYIDDILVNADSDEPVISIDLTDWDAGGVMLGDAADPGDLFQITNIGSGTLMINSITDLSSTDFATDFDTDIELAAGENYSFGFTFTPSFTDLQEEIFSIASNGGDPLEITLTGYGVNTNFWESFESDEIPDSWTVINNDGGDHSWITGSGSAAFDGTFGVEKHWEDTSDDWLISPQITIGGEDLLSFYAKAYDEEYPEDFNLYISTTGSDPGDFSITLDEVMDVPTEWTNYTYDLSGHPDLNAGDNIYIAFQCVSIDAYYLFIDAIMVGAETDAEPDEMIPGEQLSLSNYPNPFNPVTEIRFQVPGNSYLKLEVVIFNLKGQKVRTLNPSFDSSLYSVTAWQAAQDDKSEFYSVSWDGKNERSETVSSGLYFYTLQANGEALISNKMILMK